MRSQYIYTFLSVVFGFLFLQPWLSFNSSNITASVTCPGQLHMDIDGEYTVKQQAEIVDVDITVYHEGRDGPKVRNNVEKASKDVQELLIDLSGRLVTKPGEEPYQPIKHWSMPTETTGTRYPRRDPYNMYGGHEARGGKESGPDDEIKWMKTEFKVQADNIRVLNMLLETTRKMPYVKVEELSWRVSDTTTVQMGIEARQGAFRDAKRKALDFAWEAGNIPATNVKATHITKEESEHPNRSSRLSRALALSSGSLDGGDESEDRRELSIRPPQVKFVQQLHVKFVGCKRRRFWSGKLDV